MDFVEDFIQSHFPHPKSIKNSPTVAHLSHNEFSQRLAKRIEDINSSTTIIAINYDKGVIIAADKRISSGLDIVSDNSCKIIPLTDHSAVAFTGSVYTIRGMTRQIVGACSSFARFYEKLSLDGQANFISSVVGYNWEEMQILGNWYSVGIPLFVGYDTLENIPRIFDYSLSGIVSEKNSVAGNGCGWSTIKGLLEDKWHAKIKLNAAIKLAVTGLYQAGKDSHGSSEIMVVNPDVLCIDKKGIKRVADDKIRRIKERIDQQRKEKRKIK